MKRVLPLLGIALMTLALIATALQLCIAAGWRRAGRQPWPMNLGTLEAFDRGFPKQETSAAALELVRLAKPLRIDFTPQAKNQDATHKAITDYVKAHHARNTLTVDAPPAEVAAFLDAHARDIDAVRAHLLQHSGELVWPVDLSKRFEAPLPNLLAHMQLTGVLVARALARGDWDDLHAAMLLGRSLHARPDLISQAVALAIARRVNAASWKMPLPAPAWLETLDPAQHRRLFLRALQGDAWVLWRFGHEDQDVPYGFAGRPFFRAGAANLAIHQRQTATELAASGCGFDAKAFDKQRFDIVPRWNIIGRIAVPESGGLWARVLRFGAEREVAAEALRIRAGQPPAPRAKCPRWDAPDVTPPMPLELILDGV